MGVADVTDLTVLSLTADVQVEGLVATDATSVASAGRGDLVGGRPGVSTGRPLTLQDGWGRDVRSALDGTP